MAIRPDGQAVIVSYSDGTLKQWNTKIRKLTGRLFPKGRYPVSSMAIARDGKMLALS